MGLNFRRTHCVTIYQSLENVNRFNIFIKTRIRIIGLRNCHVPPKWRHSVKTFLIVERYTTTTGAVRYRGVYYRNYQGKSGSELLDKTNAKAELDATDLSVYRNAEKVTVEGLISNGKTAIDACETIEAVNTKLAEVKASIANIKTNAQLNQEEAEAVSYLIANIPSLDSSNYLEKEALVNEIGRAHV